VLFDVGSDVPLMPHLMLRRPGAAVREWLGLAKYQTFFEGCFGGADDVRFGVAFDAQPHRGLRSPGCCQKEQTGSDWAGGFYPGKSAADRR